MKRLISTNIFLVLCFTIKISTASAYISNAPGNSPCQALAGHWHGSAVIVGSFFTCHYNSDGEISAPPELVALFDFSKAENSSHFCLRHAELTAQVNCIGHQVDFTAEGQILHGSVEHNTIQLAGTFTTPILAEITSTLTKN